MPDSRKHRGRHPADDVLFAADARPRLRAGVGELSWLLERGYSPTAALKLVGDRHALRERQRRAVLRAACAEPARTDRERRRLAVPQLAGRRLGVDGFNCIIVVEAALSGGPIVIGRDRCCRDLSSVHGSYRKVTETVRAVDHLGDAIAAGGPAAVTWYLDRPVSNSGRLRQLLLERAAAHGWVWSVELVDNPDRELAGDRARVVATADAHVLDHCSDWVDLPAAVIAERVPGAWMIDVG